MSELAERLQVQHQSTVELIDRMVDRQLLTRSRDESDQRKVIIRFTPHGEEMLRRLTLLHRTELRSTGPTLVHTLDALIGSEQSDQMGGE